MAQDSAGIPPQLESHEWRRALLHDSAELRAHSRALHTQHTNAMDRARALEIECRELRETLRDYVRALRASGASPEQMIVLVKSAVEPLRSAERDAVEWLVRTAIDDYYAA